MRAATAAGRLGAAAAYGWRLCAAVYGSDAWPVDEALCTSLAADTGLDPRAFRDVLREAETSRLVASAADEAHRRGAFGVPTFFVGEEMFWGNDRVVLLAHRLGAGRGPG